MKAYYKALSSIETIKNIFAIINKLRKDYTNDTIAFNFYLPRLIIPKK